MNDNNTNTPSSEFETFISHMRTINKKTDGVSPSDHLFSDIVLFANDYIASEIIKYNNTNSCNHTIYIDCSNHIKNYATHIDALYFLKLVVSNFIDNMYYKCQKAVNLYQYTKSTSEYKDSASVTTAMDKLEYFYNKQRADYNSTASIFHCKDNFEDFNKNTRKRINKKNSQEFQYDKVLLKSEYDIYMYEKSGKFDDFFHFAKKLLRGTLHDKKHYSKEKMINAFKSLEELYKEILSNNMSYIDKFDLLYLLESRYNLETFYDWLKVFKALGINNRNSFLDHLLIFSTIQVDKYHLQKFFPNHTLFNDEKYLIIPNRIIFQSHDVCMAIAGDGDNFTSTFNIYADTIIILNIIYELSMDKLESVFGIYMIDFDFHNCQELNTFLENFIVKGQHITFNKNISEDIDTDNLRYIYSQERMF